MTRRLAALAGAVLLALLALLPALALPIGEARRWLAAGDFFWAPTPTVGTAVAASLLTVQAVTVALLLWAAAGVARLAAGRRPAWRRRTTAAAVSLVLGLVLLAAGLGRHLTPAPVDLGAGSVGEATQALGR